MNDLKSVNNQINTQPGDDEIDLRALFSQILYHKKFIALGVLLGLMLALGYLFFAKPVYTSDALLQLESDNSEFGLLSEMMVNNGLGSTSTQTEKEIIHSRTILGATIRELNLDLQITPDYFPLVGEAIARRYREDGLAEPFLFSGYAWGGETLSFEQFVIPRAYYDQRLFIERLPDNQYRLFTEEGDSILQGTIGQTASVNGWTINVTEFNARPGTGFYLQKQHMEIAIQALRSRLIIKQLGGSRNAKDIIALELEADSPQAAQIVLNEVIKHYIQYKIKSDTAAAEKTLAFINQQLDKYANDPTFNPQLYMQMTLKAQELKVLKAGELGNVRVIDYPVAPLKRSKPVTSIVLILGTMLMGMLSVLYITIRISLDRAIYNPQQIETYLNLPVYATIPMSPSQVKLDKQQNQAKALLYKEAQDDPAIEALRFLRTSMETGNLRIRKHSVIGITGPSPDVGKSFISANLSSLIAELGSRILLIDGDIRKGVLHEYYNVPREKGLADYLSGQADANEIIKTTAIPHLDVITRGALPGNPSVLMNSMKLEELLEYVKPQYDFVLIDTPPALSVTDAAVVARYCDRLVIVLRAGKTTIEEVSTCWNRLSHSGVTPSGLVMSGFDAKSYGYGVYKHYGYY